MLLLPVSFRKHSINADTFSMSYTAQIRHEQIKAVWRTVEKTHSNPEMSRTNLIIQTQSQRDFYQMMCVPKFQTKNTPATKSKYNLSTKYKFLFKLTLCKTQEIKAATNLHNY